MGTGVRFECEVVRVQRDDAAPLNGGDDTDATQRGARASSAHRSRFPVALHKVQPAEWVAGLLAQTATLTRLGMPPVFCMEHVEACLQGLWLRGQTVATALQARQAAGDLRITLPAVQSLFGLAHPDEARLLLHVAATIAPLEMPEDL